MKKIMHVITGLGPGGAESMLVKLILNMDYERFNTTVLILGSDMTKAELLLNRGIIVSSLDLTRSMSAFVKGIFRLNKIVADYNPDVIQTWLYHADFFSSIALICSRHRKKVLWNIRNSDLSNKSRAMKIIVFLLALLSRSIPVIISNSISGMHYHESLGYRPKEWEIIPNGFDPENFYPNEELRKKFRNSLNIGPSEFVIGNVSRFDPNKDYETFFKSISLIASEICNLKILIAGRGCSFENQVFANLAKKYNLDNITIALGETNQVNEILNSLDLFLFPSVNEGFPNVIGEAMLCNVPFVATKCGDIELLAGSEEFLCNVGDAKSLSKKIVTRYLNRENRSQESRKRILSHFTIEEIANKYSQLYKNFSLNSTPR